MADAGGESIPARRIRHARETTAALARMRSAPKPENTVAFHELHARHMHELGDEESAARAAKRADRAREDTRPADDAQRKRLHDAHIGRRDDTDVGATRSPGPDTRANAQV